MQPNKDHLRAMRDASKLPQPTIVDIDPEDPSQLLDDAGQYSASRTDVEAQPAAEAEADLDTAVIESSGEEDSEDNEEIETPSETTADAYAVGADDTGDLYGVHTPHAEDRDPDVTSDQESFVDSEEGENWLETLEKRAAEGGAEVEQELDVIDDSDPEAGHHSTESGDRPVADKGSGGPGGL